MLLRMERLVPEILVVIGMAIGLKWHDTDLGIFEAQWVRVRVRVRVVHCLIRLSRYKKICC